MTELPKADYAAVIRDLSAVLPGERLFTDPLRRLAYSGN